MPKIGRNERKFPHEKHICNPASHPCKEGKRACSLSTLLEQLADDLFLGKPVLLFATGGLPGYVTILERALWHELVRLGTTTIAAQVHIGTGSWITIGNDRLRLSWGAEQEVARAVDLILRGIRLNELRE